MENEQVNSFTYLGSVFEKENLNEEAKARNQKGTATKWQQSVVVCDRRMPKEVKSKETIICVAQKPGQYKRSN